MALTGANTFCKFVKQFSFTKEKPALRAALGPIKNEQKAMIFKRI